MPPGFNLEKFTQFFVLLIITDVSRTHFHQVEQREGLARHKENRLLYIYVKDDGGKDKCNNFAKSLQEKRHTI